MSKRGRVLVAMSGGVDSSVASVMLHEQGYEVIGITMKTWDYASAGGSSKETGCCSLDSINDARTLAVNYGFPHYILDIRDEFGDFVIDNFVEEYIAGRTPNPCVLCNTHIKWEALMKRADKLDCEFIATGHYANIRMHDNGRYVISKGKDENKDQSYVLWGVSQENLARTQFPLGSFTKKEIRQMALDMGQKELANKSESYEICFVPDNDYRAFLRHKVPTLDQQIGPGNFILSDGTVVGKHIGYPYFTIGQRKGLGIALGKPMFVIEILPESNTVVLGEEHELEKSHAYVRNVNFVKYAGLDQPMEAISKVRYKDSGALSTISQEDDKVRIDFVHNVKGIAPGQSAVFYEGNDLLGGGFLMK
ncbi:MULTISPECIES: tRNA 2-thiouridine(34) synthase MnmA [Sphingobacterium]|jgi:tRNA-specific 2-thiouridylase|uniref:tRNA-specific 2-thiouridylase MnmA n=1 Tax=Sphingobacterium zeae TaxID=1776859 RepID=A0ABU0U3B8_9SPHI|nr:MULTISPECIES: tRNA 2-thiouridine(34) synthase MnmA [Sphingobacterium]MDQ1149444.1 tRNA-specific 2-thiouridylase [Sphingobacterium zeae]MDR0264331.1 tRNA 2-thiouridine(34) synthase MnmA [Sphingobacterium sp.]MDR6735457.1 tRNA-specific 2-thiouridylase [Sphingobacterium sp. 2149]